MNSLLIILKLFPLILAAVQAVEQAIPLPGQGNKKLELVLDDKLVDMAVDAIIKYAATGKIGDGKIFLSKVDEVIRIRNQERGVAAL